MKVVNNSGQLIEPKGYFLEIKQRTIGRLDVKGEMGEAAEWNTCNAEHKSCKEGA